MRPPVLRAVFKTPRSPPGCITITFTVEPPSALFNSAGVPGNEGLVRQCMGIMALALIRSGAADGRIGRVHHELAAADGHQHQVAPVHLADELHVAEHAGVTHVPELEAIVELDDEAAGLTAHVQLVLVGGRVLPHVFRAVLGVHQRHLDAGTQWRDVAAAVDVVGQVAGSTPWIDRDCASPVGAQTGALFKDRDAPDFQTY
ncbi:MAG: hypothetical protein IPP44_19495 [Ideonella sp.]|nr:hypothetical protein [Ideonella sp.]